MIFTDVTQAGVTCCTQEWRRARSSFTKATRSGELSPPNYGTRGIAAKQNEFLSDVPKLTQIGHFCFGFRRLGPRAGATVLAIE